ncbi:MAG: hypothetical protein LBJ59_11525 [Zoogloeaceae bacterium]|jgi:hypothetical protein|nr:hypothetical protein [Zoogloeaceae bacterium]
MKYSLLHSTALAALILALALLAAPLPAAAQTTAAAPETSVASVALQDINLKELVPKTRMPDGQRAIFEPKSVRFTAQLAQMPTPQKADYLYKVMGMMGINNPPAVSRHIVLEYGGDKALMAYVEDQAAARFAKEAKTGEQYVFYAIYVYNNRYGPALVVTSFSK